MQSETKIQLILIGLTLIMGTVIIIYLCEEPTTTMEQPEGFPSEGKQSVDPKLTAPKLSDFLPNYSENFTHYEPTSNWR